MSDYDTQISLELFVGKLRNQQLWGTLKPIDTAASLFVVSLQDEFVRFEVSTDFNSRRD